MIPAPMKLGRSVILPVIVQFSEQLMLGAVGRKDISTCSKLIVQSKRHAELVEASLPLH